MLGSELEGGLELARLGVAAGFVEDAADDLDELELEEVEVEKRIIVQNLIHGSNQHFEVAASVVSHESENFRRIILRTEECLFLIITPKGRI